MTPTIDTQILQALRQAVTAAAGSVPVAWPGEAFSPPKTATALLPFIAVGDVQTAVRAVIGSREALDRSGILTLSYVAPIGYNAAWYVERAADLLGGFHLDSCARYLDVTVRWGNGLAVPRVERGFQDAGYIRTPCLVPWRCAA